MKKNHFLQLIFFCGLLQVIHSFGQVYPECLFLRLLPDWGYNNINLSNDTIQIQDSIWLKKRLFGMKEQFLKDTEQKAQEQIHKQVPELPSAESIQFLTPKNFQKDNLSSEIIEKAKDHFITRRAELNTALTELEKNKSEIIGIRKIISRLQVGDKIFKKEFFQPDRIGIGMSFSPDKISVLTGFLTLRFGKIFNTGAGYIYGIKKGPAIPSINGFLIFLNIATSKSTAFCLDVERLQSVYPLASSLFPENHRVINWQILPGIRRTIYSNHGFEIYGQAGINLFHKNFGTHRETLAGKFGVTWNFMKFDR